MDDVAIVVLSHRRAGRVMTHKHIAKAKICVPESQALEYAQFHDRRDLLVHPDNVVGLPAKRQWVYTTIGSCLMLDDDSSGMRRMYLHPGSRMRAVLTPERAYDVVQETAQTTHEIGAYLFGWESHAHPGVYKAFKPMRMGGYSPGGAIGILAGSKLWWPTDITLPIDDYWICCLNMYYHRYGYYDCRFSWGFVDTMIGLGGMAEFRENDNEAMATLYLMKAFGPDVIVKKRSSHFTKFASNPGGRSIRIPWLNTKKS